MSLGQAANVASYITFWTRIAQHTVTFEKIGSELLRDFIVTFVTTLKFNRVTSSSHVIERLTSMITGSSLGMSLMNSKSSSLPFCNVPGSLVFDLSIDSGGV